MSWVFFKKIYIYNYIIIYFFSHTLKMKMFKMMFGIQVYQKVDLHLFELFHRASMYSNRLTSWHRQPSFAIKAASLSSGTCGLVKINNRNIERQQAVYGTSSLFGGDASATRLLSLFMVQQEEDKCSAVTCDEAWQRKNAKPHKLYVLQATRRI